MGAATSASRQSLGSSRAKLRFSNSVPAKANTSQSRPRGDLAVGIRVQVEGKTEQQQDDQRERGRRVDRLFGANLGAQIFSRNDEHQPRKIHQPSP